MSKTIMRITSINMDRSSAEIFANGNGIECNYFNVDFEDVSGRARYGGGKMLKKAVIRKLREQHPEYKFINPKYY